MPLRIIPMRIGARITTFSLRPPHFGSAELSFCARGMAAIPTDGPQVCGTAAARMRLRQQTRQRKDLYQRRGAGADSFATSTSTLALDQGAQDWSPSVRETVGRQSTGQS